ncbi:MAG: hypothetical protein NTW62_01820 [Candidatus Nomurabacteria bacterium]|nr:hypothetical protein [Candidatus Nomurabacteria bacterium]
MIKHIHKTVHRLRQEPIHVREQIVYWVTFMCAVILFLLWSVSLGKMLTNKDIQTSIKKDVQPFTVLKDNLSDGYKSIKANSN